jgi:hypothetical protein
MYEKIKKWFNQGLWNEEKVIKAVYKGVITEEQAANILAKDE